MAQVKHFFCVIFLNEGVDIYILLILLAFFMRSKNNQHPRAQRFSAFKPVSQMLSTKLSTDSVDRLGNSCTTKVAAKSKGVAALFSGDLITRPLSCPPQCREANHSANSPSPGALRT
jgi:hypothetical protein